MTFLTVVTRCYKRPEMLQRNIRSLEQQTNGDYEQVFIVDDVGRGIGWANCALADAVVEGDYILILDDDDMLINPNAIGMLHFTTILNRQPEMVLFRTDHGEPMGVLPDDFTWGKRPVRGHIGSCSFITRQDIWDKHIRSFCTMACGDYKFLKAAWPDITNPVWLDDVFAAVQRVSHGEPE